MKINEYDEVRAASILSEFASVWSNGLIEAETKSLVALKLARLARHPLRINLNHPVSSRFETFVDSSTQAQHTLQTALLRALEERDAAHTRLANAEILHVEQMEQLRIRIRQLDKDLVSRKKSSFSNGPMLTRPFVIPGDDDSSAQSRHGSQFDSDAELVSLCQQLAAEISARTASALEILRLQESQLVEQKANDTEKLSLQKELLSLKEQLSIESKKLAVATQDCQTWKEAFESIYKTKD
jgi:hypothetical protein